VLFCIELLSTKGAEMAVISYLGPFRHLRADAASHVLAYLDA
jgi:hypothetical protein